MCGEPAGLKPNGERRLLCGSEECRRENRRRAGEAGARARTYAVGPTKRCPGCGKEKPRTTEHFAVARRDPETGEATKLDCTCKSCRAAFTRDKYRSDPAFRARVLERARAQRRRLMDRCREDPAFRERFMERRREWERARRERLRRGEPGDDASGWSRESIDARPVLAVVDHFLARTGQEREALAEAAGFPARAFSRWRTSGRASVGLVDALLIAMDLLWWEAFDPQGPAGHCMSAAEWVDAVDEAARAFEGERCLADPS